MTSNGLSGGRQSVAGLVLAGGRGSRMGGVDKGLQLLRGRPLAGHALERLRPQVAVLLISAGANAAAYDGLAERHGARVVSDPVAGQPGPLAGMLAGLLAMDTPWLVTVPCDSPAFPCDLAARLTVAALAASAPAALAVAAAPDGALRPQPVFALLHRSLAEPLRLALKAGERRVGRWLEAQGAVPVVFDDPDAFDNVNTREDLDRLERAGLARHGRDRAPGVG